MALPFYAQSFGSINDGGRESGSMHPPYVGTPAVPEPTVMRQEAFDGGEDIAPPPMYEFASLDSRPEDCVSGVPGYD